LDARYTFSISYNPARPEGQEMVEFLRNVVGCSPHLSYAVTESRQADRLEFALLRDDLPTGISFRGIPNGHEFTSLLLAVLNADGKGKNLPDEGIARRIRALKGTIRLQTYVSLTCTNCPDVVQSLNIMALTNPDITHEMVDGALFRDEVEALKIQGVPSVFANGELLHVGRSTLGELLGKLEEKFGTQTADEVAGGDEAAVQRFDLLVLGGGPAGVAAAIYSARKGLHVGLVAERIGGQVKDTVGIENLVSVPYTTGEQLGDALRTHLTAYPVALFENRRIEQAQLQGKEKRITAAGGEEFAAPAVIIATGASWRKLGVPGEAEHIGRGVAFCPHCDGPFYAGKEVAVVGGGNSGVEAAIDLSGICSKVTLLEFADTLRADTVLQEKLRALPNVEVFTSTETTRVEGDGAAVSGIRVKDRTDGTERLLNLDGIFVQIGLTPASIPFKGEVAMSERGEISIDTHGRTSVAGVYAAGDVTTVPYKQIVIAMGEGAKAALSAFEDRMRGVI
jgi:alkyl hydroperoxide reductase subunit F